MRVYDFPEKTVCPDVQDMPEETDRTGCTGDARKFSGLFRCVYSAFPAFPEVLDMSEETDRTGCIHAECISP